MTTKITVDVSQIQCGDMITHLDHGYVIDVDSDHDTRDGAYNTSIGTGMIMITMNDQRGDEFYLIAPPEMIIEIER